MTRTAKTSQTSASSATAGFERLLVLDVLRGFALFGVLLVNLPFAALPMAEAMQPSVETGAAQLIAWALVKALAETKFVSLFSLLFGIGLVLQIGRAEARGTGTRFYLRRLAILGLVGLTHGLLLWQGDILLPYAVAGFVLFLLRRRSAKTLVMIALPLLVIGLLLSTGIAWVDDGSDAGDEELSALIGQSGAWQEVEERAWTEGPLELTLSVRAVEYALWLVISSLVSFNWHVMALFCLGAAIMKRGLLGAEHRPLHGGLAAAGLVSGLLLEGAAIALWLTDGFAPGAVNAIATFVHEIGSLLLAAGYLGSVAWLVHGGAGRLMSRVEGALAAVGRTALTSYLGQSVIFNLLFPWFGLGLWGQLGRAELIAMAVLIFAAQALVASLWLRFFAMGPCEWLWRWATYGQRPRLLARAAA